jgi:hypothetical protein
MILALRSLKVLQEGKTNKPVAPAHPKSSLATIIFVWKACQPAPCPSTPATKRVKDTMALLVALEA